MPDVSVQVRIPPLRSIRSDLSSVRSATRFSSVLPRDSLHRFRRRVVRNNRLRLHETRPGLAINRMAIRFGRGFYHSRVYSSVVPSETGPSRHRQHMVEVDLTLRPRRRSRRSQKRKDLKKTCQTGGLQLCLVRLLARRRPPELAISRYDG